ncbi:hypothetical protein [Streptomyces sp. AN091965]|uniref:hypothetical protein n=1 Tax=Streptomyces sp. AN091965 TaxID=2927803 RepID=UPI0035A8A2F8
MRRAAERDDEARADEARAGGAEPRSSERPGADPRAAPGHSALGQAGQRRADATAAAVAATPTGGHRLGYDTYAGHDAYDARRPLWVEEPATRPRLPDPVRAVAVRAVLIVALTLIQAMTAFFCAMAGSWLAFPMVLSSVASTVVATWGVLDVWVTRQVWSQRNGVVSAPNSTARRLRRERRRARRAARAAARTKEGIRGRGAARQLSHS